MIFSREYRRLFLITGLLFACSPKESSSGEDTEGKISSTSQGHNTSDEATQDPTGVTQPTSGGDDGTDSTDADSTDTGAPPPLNCLPEKVDSPAAPYWKCIQYIDVKSCCGAKLMEADADSEDIVIRICADSFDKKKDGTPAPAVCPQLVGEALDCGLSVAADSCADLRSLVDAVWDAYDQSEGWLPPTDMTMPCYEEIIAAWNSGCEPNML